MLVQHFRNIWFNIFFIKWVLVGFINDLLNHLPEPSLRTKTARCFPNNHQGIPLGGMSLSVIIPRTRPSLSCNRLGLVLQEQAAVARNLVVSMGI